MNRLLARGYQISPITKTDEVNMKKIHAIAKDIEKLEKNMGVSILPRLFNASTINDMIVGGILSNDR